MWFLLPYALDGSGYPLGPDAPVYLWWLRLAGEEGLSAVGHRPGVPALGLALEGTLGLSDVQVVAALEGALGVALGLVSAALLRARGGDGQERAAASPAAWVLGGALAGTFAVHLAAGYLANLGFAVALVAAAVALASGTRSGAVGAALTVAGGGLMHPMFLLVGGGVLVLSAAFAWRSDRGEALRVGGAALGGGALVGIGLLSFLPGAGPLEVDTSKDGFLRRAGLAAELRSAYVDRFVQRWTRYVQWASVPLAVAGLRDARGFPGRFLRAWGLVTLVGIGVSLGSGVAPADRFVTFGFVVPLLAALGVIRLWTALGARRALAWLVASALTGAMLAGSWIAWERQEPFLSPLEVQRVTDATPAIGATPPGTALVFVVDDADPQVTFLATRAANVIRASVPPTRIRDVVVIVPAATGPSSPTRDALTRVTLADATAAVERAGGRRFDVLLAPFDRVDAATADDPGSGWHRMSRGVFVQGTQTDAPSGDPLDPLVPSSPLGIALATVGALAAVALAGFGWARILTRDPVDALALAPALGTVAITLVAIAAERLGAPLDGGATGLVVSALAGGGGELARFVLERRAPA